MKFLNHFLRITAFGLIMGLVTSCSLLQDSSDVHFDTCSENCILDHALDRNYSNNAGFCGFGETN